MWIVVGLKYDFAKFGYTITNTIFIHSRDILLGLMNDLRSTYNMPIINMINIKFGKCYLLNAFFFNKMISISLREKHILDNQNTYSVKCLIFNSIP